MNWNSIPLKVGALSAKPMTILPHRAREFLMTLHELDLLETCDPSLRRSWQNSQIENLLRHAASRSTFWKERIDLAAGFEKLPVQTRSDARREFANGSLVRSQDGVQVFKGRSSGSSGSPVEYYETETNRAYGLARTVLQLLRAGVQLGLNFVDFRNINEEAEYGFRIQERRTAFGPLSEIMELGNSRQVGVNSQFDEDRLLSVLALQPCQIFTCPPRVSRLLARLVGRGDQRISKLGIRYYLPRGDRVDPDFRDALARIGITTVSNYSSTEVGAIGDECLEHPGCYHIATSNVLVEHGGVDLTGMRPLLITHLHSYASPFIRYDIGDSGELSETCPFCNHAGPTIAHLFGRRAGLVRLADGTMRPFEVTYAKLREVVDDLMDFRVTQEDLSRFTVEVDVGRELLASELEGIRAYLGSVVAPGSYSIVSGVIDWGKSSKRHVFRSLL